MAILAPAPPAAHTLTIVAQAPTGTSPEGIGVDPATGRVFVANPSCNSVMVLPVVVDRNDAQRIEVDLDGVPSLRDRAAAEQQRVIDAMTGDSVPGPNPNARPEGSEPAPSDQIISALERLERLHQSGALTDDEFEAQKALIAAT